MCKSTFNQMRTQFWLLLNCQGGSTASVQISNCQMSKSNSIKYRQSLQEIINYKKFCFAKNTQASLLQIILLIVVILTSFFNFQNIAYHLN